MPEPWSLLALPPLDEDLLRALFADLPVTLSVPAERTQPAAVDAVSHADLVIGDWSGAMRVDADLVAAARRVVFIQQPSVGVDSVDVAACTDAGIPLANVGDANAVSVAEWCLGATLAGLRSLAFADAEVRSGRWPQLELAERGGGELAGRRVGLIGMGGIARAAATRYAALGCDVAHWSRTRREPEQAGGARWLPFEDLLRHAQVLVVLVALTPQTRGLVDAEALALLPQGAMVVDAARGGIVVEDALVSAVRSGALAGAALDVYAEEPLPKDSPLRQLDRVLLSPHAAGATQQAQSRLIGSVIDNVKRAVTGEPVVNVVNGIEGVIRRREA